MPFTHGQSNSAIGSGTSLTCALSNPVGAADLLVAIVRTADAPPLLANISDNVNGAWDGMTPGLGSPANVVLAWKLASVAASSLTVSVTASSGTIRIALSRFTVSGGTAALLGTASHSAQTTTALDCGTLGDTLGASLLFGGGASGTNSLTFTAGTANGVAATIGAQAGDVALGSIFNAYVLSTAAGTQTMSATASGGSAGGLNAWEALFGLQSSPPRPFLPLMAPQGM